MRMCGKKSLIFQEDNKVGSNTRFSCFVSFTVVKHYYLQVQLFSCHMMR